MRLDLHITIAQINPLVGDITGNTAMIAALWREHAGTSDLLVLPELALCGYPPEDLPRNPAFHDALTRSIETLAALSQDRKCALLLPAPHLHDGNLYNAVHLIDGGRIRATRLKHPLPNYGVFDERRHFTPGPLPKPIPFRGRRLGIMICEDMWFPDVARHLCKHGAHVLLTVNASPFEADKHEQRLFHAAARARETGLPLLYVNQVGGQDELVFDGASFALDANGVLIFQAPDFITATETLRFDRIFSCLASAMLEGGPARICKAAALGLHDYVTKNKFPGVLLGLSGGIDSALSAAIAVDALGPSRVRGIMLPSVYTSQDSLDDAETLARNLGIRIDTIPIAPTIAALEDALKPHMPPDAPGITFENLQSRARGLILMGISNATGFMVLSTGNKSEVSVGYATLYGDMCGGFNALKDIYKTQVYALSRWRNTKTPVIPERSITKAPTAELRPNQTDQDSLPPYDMLDAILESLIEREESMETLAANGHDPVTVRRIRTLLDRAEFKRRQSAPGVKITARAFGRDRRYPMTNGFSENPA